MLKRLFMFEYLVKKNLVELKTKLNYNYMGDEITYYIRK